MVVRDNLQQPFNSTASGSAGEAEQCLKTWGIEYTRQPDGALFVPGDLDISHKGLTRLPDLSSVRVGGSFSVANNKLTSLEGAPTEVGTSFICSDNQLISLKGAPTVLGGYFACQNNPVKTLEYAPQVSTGIYSNFGNYFDWDRIPESLRGSPDPDVLSKPERQAKAEKAIYDAVVLQAPMGIGRPLKLKK